MILSAPRIAGGTALRRRGALALLAIGGLGWLLLFVPLAGSRWTVFLSVGSNGPAAMGIVLALAWAGARWRPMRDSLDATPLADPRASVAAGAVAGIYLAVTAFEQHRQFFSYVQDESSYLIQAHQMAHGRLWYPAHPLGASFDSFQLLTCGRVYASAYFPGTALLHVPGIWLGLPPCVTTLTAAAAVVGLFHWIVSRCLDRTAGWLGVLLLLACPMFRTVSTMTLGQIPLLLYALAAVAAWMRWLGRCRDGGGLASAAFCGLFLGCAAITRPVDAMCFGFPIISASLFARPPRRVLAGAICFSVGLLPAVTLQGISDRGITGYWLTTPFRVYADRDYPNTSYGFHRFDPSARPASVLLEKQAMYLNEYQPLIRAHRPDRVWPSLIHQRLPVLLSEGGGVTPFPLLAALWPAAIATLCRRRPFRAVMLATLPLFLIGYIPYVFFFPHYLTTGVPALVLGVLVTLREVPPLLPVQSAGLKAFGTIAVALLATAALPQFDSMQSDDLFNPTLIRKVNHQLADIHEPAIVLFRYSANSNFHEEPVYNADVAWPDDAFTIRAHDLDAAQNQKLLRYYAGIAPSRIVYRYDEADCSLTRLGPVSALSAL